MSRAALRLKMMRIRNEPKSAAIRRCWSLTERAHKGYWEEGVIEVV